MPVDGFHRFDDLGDAAVQRFHRFHCRVVNPGMTHHIAIWIVADDGVVLAAVNGGQQFVGQFGGAHFWLQIVGRDLR
ncbi:hypothetical protein D3C76_1793980 [compost metagenome]